MIDAGTGGNDMGWFSKKPTCPEIAVCAACGVHYDPRKGEQWFMYCTGCRKPHKERQDRIDLVKDWACANFEKLEPQAKKWRKKTNENFSEAFRSQQGALRPQNPLGPYQGQWAQSRSFLDGYYIGGI